MGDREMNQRNQTAKSFAQSLDPKLYDDYLIWAEVEIREYKKFIKAIKELKFQKLNNK